MLYNDQKATSGLFGECEAELKKYGYTVVYFPYMQKVTSTKLHERSKPGAKPTVEALVQVKIEGTKKASLFGKLAKSLKIKRNAK